ncbi:MAG: response regulator transcription factor [Spirochaetota bacterium]
MGNNKYILVVDDEVEIQELIRFNLEREGFSVTTVSTGEQALASLGRSLPDLIILDLMLPGMDGLEVCRALSSYEVPILMVTAKSDDSDIILGLEMGADDYVTKPFSPRVLAARTKAVLRRKGKELPPKDGTKSISLHGIHIDPARHTVSVEDKPIDLSVTEFGILEFLMHNPGWVFSRSQIIESVKGDDYPVTERSVDVQILAIRKKLGNKGSIIETVRGIGYRLIEPQE